MCLLSLTGFVNCAPNVSHGAIQVAFLKAHVHNVSLQCEYECASSDSHSLQTDRRMFHMYMVSLQYVYECAFSDGYSVQTGHRMFHIYMSEAFRANRAPHVSHL